MIKVDLIKNEQKVIGLTVTGHAQAAAYGNDLVCAAVSAIITGGFNAFLDEDIVEIALKEGYAKIIVSTKRGEDILNVLLTQLKTIEETYPKNIAIH